MARQPQDVFGLVSEVMSTQTTVGRAARAWVRWIERCPDVESPAAASLADAHGEWQDLEYPRRARGPHRSARIVASSGWPDDMTKLPGVGPYIASAIRCFAHEQPVLPVDLNLARVLERRSASTSRPTPGGPG